MPERVAMKLRHLPEGEFQEACRVSSQGRYWELDVPRETPQLGSLLEIEHGSTVYWGVVEELDGSKATVLIEHSLETSRLKPIREVWGE